MIHRTDITRAYKALLIVGSALALICCGGNGPSKVSKAERSDRVLNEISHNLTVVMSKSGRPSYIFVSPLVEGYTLGKEPYREFREGIEIDTFSDDSLSTRNSHLVANYAIYYESRELWETRGDVRVKKSDGKELYSEQLFWNAQTQRIYSNVETKIVDTNTGDVYEGEGFESDEAMEEWTFRRLTGRMRMDFTPNEEVEEEDLPNDKDKE